MAVGEAFQGEKSSLLEDSVSALGDLGLSSELQAEMLRHLIHGPRTVTELVELIYRVPRAEQSFPSYYMKVRRAIRKLESKGMVSTRIFGRDRPYRLTKYAIERLYSLARPDVSPDSLLTVPDLVVYVSTLASGLATVLLVLQGTDSTRPIWTVLLSGSFAYLLGFSSSRILRLLGRIA